MRKKIIIGSIIISVITIIGIGMHLIHKGEQGLDTYSEAVETQTDADVKEIIDGNGPHFFEAGKFQIYIPFGYTQDMQDGSVYYWKCNEGEAQSQTDAKDIVISISYEPDNTYNYEELINVYYDNIQKNFKDINMTTIHMDDKNFVYYDYSDDNYFYSTIILTEYTFGKNGRHLCCITAMSGTQNKDNIKDVIMLIAGNSTLKGE